MVKRCYMCFRAGWDCDIYCCAHDPVRNCSRFGWTDNTDKLEAAIREAGLEKRYAERLLACVGRYGLGQLEWCGLTLLTPEQRATAARETLEEGE